MKTLQFILKSQIKSSKVRQKPSGFTLVELLVALVIASLIITPLLGFMVNVLTTDSREQAKANSEEEIQNALNYISRDMEQAVYIYDADGLEAIKSELLYPGDAEKSPILVFWKRELVPDVITAADGSADDAFVYSLVAYYLIKDAIPSTTWSKAARIARWQIKDGVRASTGGVTCPGYNADLKYVNSANCPTPGFLPFKETGNLTEGMKAWKKNGVAYTTPPNVNVLIDYVDQTQNPPGLNATCPPNSTDPQITWSAVTPANNMTGFYACVDVENTTAQLLIRGNVLARIQNDVNKINYTAGNQTYFPTTSVRVKGRGFLVR